LLNIAWPGKSLLHLATQGNTDGASQISSKKKALRRSQGLFRLAVKAGQGYLTLLGDLLPEVVVVGDVTVTLAGPA
jgi:hypothetical protein